MVKLPPKAVEETPEPVVIEITKPIPNTTNWNVVINIIVTAIVSIAVAYFQYRTELAVRGAKASITKIEKVNDQIHTLVNSNMGLSLQANSDLSDWKAEREPTAINIEAARLSKEKLQEHNKQQNKADEDAKKTSGPLSLSESSIVKSAFIRGMKEGQKESENAK